MKETFNKWLDAYSNSAVPEIAAAITALGLCVAGVTYKPNMKSTQSVQQPCETDPLVQTKIKNETATGSKPICAP